MASAPRTVESAALVHKPARAAAAPAARSRATYVGHALAHPVTCLTLLGGVALGVYAGSLLVAVAVAVLAGGEASLLARNRRFRAALDDYLARRDRLERRDARVLRLEQAGITRDGLAELTVLVDEIERQDPALAARHDLEGLLDHWVDLAAAHERCLRTLRGTDRAALARAQLDGGAVAPGSPAALRLRIIERRIRLWEEARLHADRLGDQLDALLELVRLVAERCARPEPPGADDTFDRALAALDELDAEDATRRLLSRRA